MRESIDESISTIHQENTRRPIWLVRNIAHTYKHNISSKCQPTGAERFENFSFTIIYIVLNTLQSHISAPDVLDVSSRWTTDYYVHSPINKTV